MKFLKLLPFFIPLATADQNPPGTNFGLGPSTGWCTTNRPSLKVEDNGSLTVLTPGMAATTMPARGSKVECIVRLDVLAPPNWQFQIRPGFISGQALVTGEREAEIRPGWFGSGGGGNSVGLVVTNKTEANFNVDLRRYILFNEPRWTDCSSEGQVLDMNLRLKTDFIRSLGKPGFGVVSTEKWQWDLRWRQCSPGRTSHFDH